MLDSQKLLPTRVGLRSYDTAIGFRNLDETNATIAEFSATHIIGMAAVLAGAIKGRDIIKDAKKLKYIAADVLKINPWAFDKIIFELAELGVVRSINQRAGEIISFNENIPLLYDNLHELLGLRWQNLHPSELEEQFIFALDKLAYAPLPEDELFERIGGNERAISKIKIVGEGASLIDYHPLKDGRKIVISPLHAFENPGNITKLFEHYQSQEIQAAFKNVRAKPGYPVLMGNNQTIQREILIEEMIRIGLIPAPTVIGADHQKRAFAIVPYGLDPVFLTSQKQILDRALALIACVRCGEISGGVTAIRMPDRILAALIDPGRNYTLRGHSSTPRQYAPLIRLGMIEPVHVMSDRWGAHLIPTEDNIKAVELARILLQRQGEGLPERGNEQRAATLLFTDGEYLNPISTIASAKRNLPRMSSVELIEAWNQVRVGEL